MGTKMRFSWLAGIHLVLEATFGGGTVASMLVVELEKLILGNMRPRMRI